jgi:small subunit ribosomal protein S19e
MNVSKQELIIALSKELKVMIKKPEWAELVKTGVFKERPPVDSDWWYMRAASMLLKIQKLEPVGVSKLRTKYGGRKNMGVAPEHFFKGSGKIIRTIFQQLEIAGLLKQEKKGVHKGRALTGKAMSLIAGVSRKLEKPRQKLVEKKIEEKKEATESKDSELSAKQKEPKKEEIKKEEPKAPPALTEKQSTQKSELL